jgi:hypothetical protein
MINGIKCSGSTMGVLDIMIPWIYIYISQREIQSLALLCYCLLEFTIIL